MSSDSDELFDAADPVALAVEATAPDANLAAEAVAPEVDLAAETVEPDVLPADDPDTDVDMLELLPHSDTDSDALLYSDQEDETFPRQIVRIQRSRRKLVFMKESGTQVFIAIVSSVVYK